MKIKRYVAPSMPEAMRLIRNELGSQAVILNSKPLRTGGILGLFAKKQVEVVAGVDVTPAFQKKESLKAEVTPLPMKEAVTSDEAGIIKQLEELKMKQLEEQKRRREADEAERSKSPRVVPALQSLLQSLREHEVAASVLQNLANDLAEVHPSEVYQKANEWIQQKIAPYVEERRLFPKKYIMLVGPTGVGKTTTLAKIASKYVIEQQQKIAFITTDTYRIGAVEQLRTYAYILNVPVEVCYNRDDFKEAIRKFQDYDYVFIDTAGRNFKEEKYIDQLKEIVHYENEVEKVLVLALTARYRDMVRVYKQFQTIGVDSIILTKSEETDILGAALNFTFHHQQPLAYITNGQNVPDDIFAPSASYIAKTLLGEERDA